MKGQSAPSAILRQQNWEEWLIRQRAMLPFRDIWTGWRTGQRGSSWSIQRQVQSAVPTEECTSAGWGLTSSMKKDVGILVSSKLTMTQKHAFVVKKPNGIWGCIRYSVASRSREVILPLYSVLWRPHLDYYGFWVPKYERDMKYLEIIEQRTAKMIRSLHHLSYEEDCKKHTSLAWKRLRDLIHIQIC